MVQTIDEGSNRQILESSSEITNRQNTCCQGLVDQNVDLQTKRADRYQRHQGTRVDARHYLKTKEIDRRDPGSP